MFTFLKKQNTRKHPRSWISCRLLLYFFLSYTQAEGDSFVSLLLRSCFFIIAMFFLSMNFLMNFVDFSIGFLLFFSYCLLVLIYFVVFLVCLPVWVILSYDFSMKKSVVVFFSTIVVFSSPNNMIWHGCI